jgi:hypothetical protein
MAYRDDEITGIRGWLLFFFLSHAVISPLLLIYRLLISIGAASEVVMSDGWPVYINAIRALFVAALIASWLLAARLWFVRNWSTVRIVIGVIWVINVGASLFDFAAMTVLLGVDMGSAFEASAPGIARGVIYCAVWTAYLLRSRRVANTYHRYPDDNRLAAVFD